MRKHDWIDVKSIKYLKSDNKTKSILKTLIEFGYLDSLYSIYLFIDNLKQFLF